MSVTVRAPRPGDGAGMARVWLSAAAYYADLDPEYFQVPSAEGLAESFEAAPWTAGEDALMLVAELDGQVSIVFQKPLRLLVNGATGARTA